MEKQENTANVADLSPGERLQVLLDELRLTQTALADMCSVSPQYVNNIVRGGQRVTEDFAIKVAEVTSVDLHWLFTGAGPMLRLEDRAKEPGIIYETGSLEVLLRDTAERLTRIAERLAKMGH